MPVQPYAPATYRPDRVILFATQNNETMRVDESILTQDGSTITGYWISPTLNRDQEGISREFTLSKVILYYSATGATTVTLTASGDGGENWTAINADTATTAIAQTAGRVENVVAPFNVTGADLRLRIQFKTDVAVKIVGFTPTLIRRGRVNMS